MDSITNKRHLTDDEISNFLSKSTRKHYDDLDKSFSPDSIALMSYLASQIVDAVAGIVKLPSKFAVDEFKRTTTNKRLLHSLSNPYIELALDLKQLYDSRLIPLFDSFLKFDKQKGPLFSLRDDAKYLERNKTINEFFERSYSFLPDLPEIKDPVMYEAFYGRKPILFSTLVSVGKRYYEAVSSTILRERFHDREIEEFTLFTEDVRVVDHWNILYKRKIQSDPDSLTVPYYNNFYAYVGALASVNQLADLKEWLTILLEPLIQQFSPEDDATDQSIEALKEKIPDATCHNIYANTNSHGEKVFIVQYKYKSFVLGTASSDTLDKAEAKAATNALYNTTLLESVTKLNHDELESESLQPLPFDQHISQSTQFKPELGPGFKPLQSDIPLSKVNGQLHSQFPPTAQVVRDIPDPQTSVQMLSNGAPMAVSRTSMVKEEPGYDESDVFNFPDPIEDSKIDNSSKERLNALLTQKKLSSAEYKTAKVGNSEVEVTLWIQNKPIAKTSSTNKKKAGQYVAQQVLEYFDYFMHSKGIIWNARLAAGGN